ncbi:hypothetical protein PPSIR1_29368 [Plesiocystis pacifica SIR-1]|uniref:Lipoprotein n=1 Tax=Plesiocystis pacifica SIR-1 TaxID=391625 RepID=A6G641_9BACT|nr:hypothetical protein [Plesiocystis pacifica]EDM78643.1 hypothetical protein PPSIR1_29368 [Plesiocystis pacifica SIR-1]
MRARLAPLVPALALTFAALGCAPEPIDDEGADTDGTDEGADTGPEPSSETPIYYSVGEALWRIEADGATALGLTIDPPAGWGSNGTGTHTPTVSADGSRLAYLRGEDLWIASVDTDSLEVDETLLIDLPDGARMAFSEWSPVGHDLIVFIVDLSDGGPGEPPPPPELPEGLIYGANVVDGDALTVTAAAHILGYHEWLADGSAVVHNRFGEGLVAYPLVEGPSELLLANESFGFSQLDIVGSRMVWTQLIGDEAAQIYLIDLELDGATSVAMSPLGDFAQIQWPRLAPSTDRVVARIDEHTHLCEGEAGEQELPALSRRPHWLSDEQLVDVTEAGLVRVDIDGDLTVLDAAATGLVRL